ncbi:DUF547 domain-containing protein [Aquimarina brevivitae]|uniref:Uncharacterized protein DUF547 n=1 Tax=Aquimarina brevivitae TaxID=323412 RepID=A0A4V2F7G8_9FLAO|nr:DUF547 domain-containing protein [Aquimarina brevivitae]RZS99769.1 uncharacterized protein DUF547 [Aquimarina brevivitae]
MKTKKLNTIASLIFFALTLVVTGQNKFDHSTWDQALILNVSTDGLVNYNGFMKDSSLLYTYFQQLTENKPDASWSKDEQMAYWINTYNAYTIKLIIDSYPVKSIKDLKDPWDKKFFKIDGEWFSLNDIEHKILRKFGDPRIHFAINCASYSCPVVLNRAYTAANLQRLLEQQTKKFINDPTRNTITPTEVKVSKIFSWYKRDFKTDNKDVVDFINSYANVKISNQPNKGYADYDWSLNETKINPTTYVLD